jgi:hypothetical protein
VDAVGRTDEPVYLPGHAPYVVPAPPRVADGPASGELAAPATVHERARHRLYRRYGVPEDQDGQVHVRGARAHSPVNGELAAIVHNPVPGAIGDVVRGQHSAIVDQEPGTNEGGALKFISDEYVPDPHSWLLRVA